MANAIHFQFYPCLWKITKENRYFKKKNKPTHHFGFVEQTIRINHLTVIGI